MQNIIIYKITETGQLKWIFINHGKTIALSTLRLWPTCSCSSSDSDDESSSPFSICNRCGQKNNHMMYGLKVYLWFNFIETWPRERNKRNVITSLSLSSGWVGATHVQHKKTNTFKSLSCSPLLSGRRKLIKLPEFASHIYWNVTFTELACLQPLLPTEKNYRRRGDFFTRYYHQLR